MEGERESGDKNLSKFSKFNVSKEGNCSNLAYKYSLKWYKKEKLFYANLEPILPFYLDFKMVEVEEDPITHIRDKIPIIQMMLKRVNWLSQQNY